MPGQTLSIAIRPSGTPLAAAHAEILAAGRFGPIDWSGFAADQLAPEVRAAGIASWNARLADEYRSATLFSQYQTLLFLANPPIDVIGACARVVADEVRHVALCADVVAALGGVPAAAIAAADAYLLVAAERPLLPQLLALTASMFCLGESVSARLIAATRAVTREGPIRDVLGSILADEAFHGEFGWRVLEVLLPAAGAGERAELAAMLPAAFASLEATCLREPTAVPHPDEAAIGIMPMAGHRAAFAAAVEEVLLPRLEALGLPAREAWAAR